MEAVEALGFVAGAVISTALIPQVWRLFRLKSAREISLPFNILFLLGGILWLVFGVLRESPSIIVSNAVNVALVSAMLYAKVKYGRQPQGRAAPRPAPGGPMEGPP